MGTEDLQNQLRMMLVAAGVGGYDLNVSGLGMNTTTLSSSSSSWQEDEVECINPLVQDVQSWTCDCFEEMRHQCQSHGAADELCVRAQICEHPGVCRSWKEQACDEPEIQDMQATLQSGTSAGAHRALLSRREDGSDEDVFDRALAHKACVKVPCWSTRCGLKWTLLLFLHVQTSSPARPCAPTWICTAF